MQWFRTVYSYPPAAGTLRRSASGATVDQHVMSYVHDAPSCGSSGTVRPGGSTTKLRAQSAGAPRKRKPSSLATESRTHRDMFTILGPDADHFERAPAHAVRAG